MIDRRHVLIGLAGGVLGGLTVSRRAFAQAAATVRFNDRLSLLSSGGTNVLALSTADGLVVVDSGAAEFRDRLTASLRQLPGGQHVATLFNTHYHEQNTAANDALRQDGTAIVAHEKTRLWMATPVWLPAEDRYRQPRPLAARPTRTFYLEESLKAGTERIDYGYLIEAHTSGDIYVFFRDANVLAVGDIAAPVRDPEFDYLTGAWLGGRVDALTRLLKIVDDKTRIVPCFGPVLSRDELQAEHDMMKTIYDRAVDRVREGDSAADMLTGGLLNGLGRTFKDPGKFLYDVHKGLWAHHNKLNANVV